MTTLACGVSSLPRAVRGAPSNAARRWCSSTTGSSGATSRSSSTHACGAGSRRSSAGNASLVAYHLALDAHPELGNSAQLAARIGASDDGPVRLVGRDCSLTTRFRSPSLADACAVRSSGSRSYSPRGPDEIRRIAVTTGGAGYDLVQAAHEGYDALLTGEPEEPSAAAARELGVHLIAAGHHATERFGVQALAAHLAERFGLAWEYVEIANPV